MGWIHYRNGQSRYYDGTCKLSALIDPVEHMGFVASIEGGAQALRSIWPCLPRHGEDDAWTSRKAMAQYIAAYDEDKRGPGPWIPDNAPDTYVEVRVGDPDRLIVAKPNPDMPWMAHWAVHFRPCPLMREAELLAYLLEHRHILFWIDQLMP